MYVCIYIYIYSLGRARALLGRLLPEAGHDVPENLLEYNNCLQHRIKYRLHYKYIQYRICYNII